MRIHSINVLFLLLSVIKISQAQQCLTAPSCFGCDDSTSDIRITCAGGHLTVFPNLPESVQSRVDELNLRSNAITEITAEDLANYTRLETLDISFNNLSSIEEGSFRNNSNLMELDLSYSHLTSIPELLFTDTQLISLNLRDNFIESFSAETFTGLQTFSQLDLRNNLIQNLPSDVFSTIGLLDELTLTGNPLVCDCHLSWLPLYLTDTSIRPLIFDFGECTTPALNLTVADVASLTQENFQCSCDPECVNGHCNETAGECTCENGYQGDYCQAECTDGYYGEGCIGECNCQNGAGCDHITGECNCTSGWRGDTCENECTDGYYGEDCVEECDCQNGASCDHITGECSCSSGWRGDTCENECTDGYYGEDCVEECDCQNGASCDHITGECSCSSGWRGDTCEDECEDGTYGPECEHYCSCIPDNTISCDRFDGSCYCMTKYHGPTCENIHPTQPQPTTASTTTKQPLQATSPSPLSTGSIIGIAVGAVLTTSVIIIITLVLLVGLLCMYAQDYRRNRQISPSPSTANQNLIQPDSPELEKGTDSVGEGDMLRPSAPEQPDLLPPPSYDEVVGEKSRCDIEQTEVGDSGPSHLDTAVGSNHSLNTSM